MNQTVLITGGPGFLGKRLGIAMKDHYRVVLTGRNNKHNLDAQQFAGSPTLPMDVKNIEFMRNDCLRIARAGWGLAFWVRKIA